jgi:hypothetical protein
MSFIDMKFPDMNERLLLEKFLKLQGITMKEYHLNMYGSFVKFKTLCKIEKALGFKLHKWQKEYLFDDKEIPWDIWQQRANGKTTIEIVKFILNNDSIDVRDIEKLVIRSGSKRWFRNMFIFIHEKLTNEGLKTCVLNVR